MSDLYVPTGRHWTLTIKAPGEWTSKPPKGKEKQPPPPGGWPIRPEPNWLTMNSRLHWRAKDRLRAQWQERTRAAALAAVDHTGKVGRLPSDGQVIRARVSAILHFARPADRDLSNWQPTAKVIQDALIKGNSRHRRWGFMPDDNTKRNLHCPDCPHLREHPELLVSKPPFGPVGMVTFTLAEVEPAVVGV